LQPTAENPNVQPKTAVDESAIRGARNHDDRQIGMGLANGLQSRNAPRIRQAGIEQHQIRPLPLMQMLETRRQRADFGDRRARKSAFYGEAQANPHDFVVINQQAGNHKKIHDFNIDAACTGLLRNHQFPAAARRRNGIVAIRLA
jgi:hypothetical protein